MQNLKINAPTGEVSKETSFLLEQLGYRWQEGVNQQYRDSCAYFYTSADGIVSGGFSPEIFERSSHKGVNISQLRDMVVLHRNDVSDANYSITIASDRPDTPVYKTSDAIYYTYSDHNNKWVFCNSIKSTTTGLKKINKQSDAAASPNDIARTAEDHRENNLSNELNDLCNEFGCLSGNDRMWWLRDQLTKAAPFNQQETLYHYAASINTARGTVAYDGVITFPGRITSMEDYQQARAEIAKDGNVAPEQVNIHSLSVIS